MADTKRSNEDEGMTFREGMAKLEKIVESLESGQLELEESLTEYSEGIQLVRELQKRLAGAEQQVEVLMGELEEAPSDEVQDTTLNKA